MAASISMRSEDVKTGGIARDSSVKRYADVEAEGLRALKE